MLWRRIFPQSPPRSAAWGATSTILDMQYVVSGVERMGYAPCASCEMVDKDPEGQDATFCRELEGENFVDMGPGAYCVFFSNSIHRPAAPPDNPAMCARLW